jgi:hypothetical protein
MKNQLYDTNGKYYLKARKTVPSYIRPMSMLLLHLSIKMATD